MAIFFKGHGFLYVAFVAAAFVESVPSLPKFTGLRFIGVGAAALLTGITFC